LSIEYRDKYQLEYFGKKTIVKQLKWLCIFVIAALSFAPDGGAGGLFLGRQIHLSKNDNSIFRIGVTGTTAGYNYIALVEEAKQESIPLGNLGYWELVADPPSFLRNYDLQLIITNLYKGKFKIEFEYDRDRNDISYRVLEGAIQLTLDNQNYYPKMIIEKALLETRSAGDAAIQRGAKRFLFFDFNSFDADLRRHYGKVKRLLENPDHTAYFFYFESANYDSYYFKTYQDTAKLDTEKMGLSLENGTLTYYQKVLDNLKSRHGNDFTNQIIVVSRYGKKFSRELKKYAHDIGMSADMVVTFWSYEDIQ